MPDLTPAHGPYPFAAATFVDPAKPRLDLDGLQVFDAVMREGNVTRAADRLGLTQPAVSHTLARLRSVFGDPLFLRTAGGVKPTRRAEELFLEVQEPLDGLRRAMSPGRFDAASADFSVSVAVNDMISQELMPVWYAALRTSAPHMRLNLVMRTFGETESRLVQGTLDFGIGLFAALPSSLRRREIWRDPYACAFRRGNPIEQRPWTAETFQEAAHVRVSPNGERYALADVGIRYSGRENVALTVSHFSCIPKMLRTTDLVALLPRFYACAVAREHDLVVREVPFALEPVKYELVWHERAERSQALGWFRQRVLQDLRPG